MRMWRGKFRLGSSAPRTFFFQYFFFFWPDHFLLDAGRVYTIGIGRALTNKWKKKYLTIKNMESKLFLLLLLPPPRGHSGYDSTSLITKELFSPPSLYQEVKKRRPRKKRKVGTWEWKSHSSIYLKSLLSWKKKTSRPPPSIYGSCITIATTLWL
jgi:hypothetical protein